mgnify:FL=1
MNKEIYDILDYYIPNPKCELDYNSPFELLIATILSAQCTDKRVNIVTKELFKKYDINSLANASKKDIEDIIRSCGSYSKKSEYIITVSKRLLKDYNGIVPNDRKYLESLPGVGRKTTNVVLKNIYNEPTIPVDTHVERVSKRLGFAGINDSVTIIEKKLMKKIPKDKWNRVSEQILLFGRYYCTSKNPKCLDCKFKNYCKYKKNS